MKWCRHHYIKFLIPTWFPQCNDLRTLFHCCISKFLFHAFCYSWTHQYSIQSIIQSIYLHIKKKITSIDKLSLIIKVPLVNVLNFILFPFHSSWNLTSLIILSIKFISIFYIHFLSLSVEKVVFELTIIHETLGDVWTILEHVVGEFSLCVWSIFENQNTLTISFSVREWTNVKRSVIFVKSTISTGVAHLVDYDRKVRY